MSSIKLDIVTPTFGHEVSHLATWFLPSEVWILKFRTAHVCSKRGEEHRNEGFVHVFLGLLEENFDVFCPFSEGRHLGCLGFGDVVFHCFFAF